MALPSLYIIRRKSDGAYGAKASTWLGTGLGSSWFTFDRAKARFFTRKSDIMKSRFVLGDMWIHWKTNWDKSYQFRVEAWRAAFLEKCDIVEVQFTEVEPDGH